MPTVVHLLQGGAPHWQPAAVAGLGTAGAVAVVAVIWWLVAARRRQPAPQRARPAPPPPPAAPRPATPPPPPPPAREPDPAPLRESSLLLEFEPAWHLPPPPPPDVPAAGPAVIACPLPKMASSDVDRRPPAMTFLASPDGTGRAVHRHTPRPLPAALHTDRPQPDPLAVIGVARYFPRHTIHATRAASADGEPCLMTDIDHYHVRRLVADVPTRLPDLAWSAPQRRSPVLTTVSTVWETVDGARSAFAYVEETSVIPVGDLLAGSDELRRTLAAAGASAAFLRALLRESGLDAEAAGLSPAMVAALFGRATVQRRCAVLVPVPEPGDGWPPRY